MSRVAETPDPPGVVPAEQDQGSERRWLTSPSRANGFPGRFSRPGKRWIKRLGISVCVLVVVVGCGVAYTLHLVGVADRRHTAFKNTGQDIKGFLASYAGALVQAAKDGNATPIGEFYADDYHCSTRGNWVFATQQDLGGVTLSRMAAVETDTLDRTKVLNQWLAYLTQVAEIDAVKCKLGLIEAAEPDGHAVITVKYVLDGKDSGGNLVQDRLDFRLYLERHAESSLYEWKIVKDELIEGVREAGPADALVSLDPTSIGIDYVHHRDPKLDKNAPGVELKFSVIEHAFGGVSAVDILGNDGLPELLFLDGKDSRLYRNATTSGSTDVKFVDVTSETGLAGIDQAHSALFVDFDNDGDKDLFVSRYMAPCKLYRNDGHGHFADATLEFGLDITRPCVSACVLDFDADGYLDIYVGVNGNSFKQAPDIPFYAVNGLPNILLRNVEGQRFVDVTEVSGTGSTGWTLAVTSGDFNSDGRPDIAVANDFGRKVLYRNEGHGKFTDCTKEAGVLDFSGGMGVAFADLNGDEFPDLFTSNIESGQRWFGDEITLWQYMRNIARTKWIFDDLAEFRELYGLLGDDWRQLGLQIGRGNSVFSNNQDGTFEEWQDCNAKRAGWAWSVNPFDYDNDTDLDLYVANGWISGPDAAAPDL